MTGSLMNVTIVGEQELITKIRAMPESVHRALLAKVRSLAIRLQAHIQKDKLSGQVLNVVTGALRRSIHNRVLDEGMAIFGEVFSSGDVKYAAIHEFGGKTRAHDIFPKKADALFFMMGDRKVFAKVVHHPGSKIPERSFMSTGLAEYAETIVTEMKQAVVQGLMVGRA